MKPLVRRLLASLSVTIALAAPLAAAPLRVVVSSDNNTFTDAYATALKNHGAQVVTSAMPDDRTLSSADVVLLHRSEYDDLPSPALDALKSFAEDGGGIVAVNAAIAAGDEAWGESVLGGSWDDEYSRRFESLMMLYVVTDRHPIVKDASPFDVTDFTLYDLNLSRDIHVVASAFTPKGRDEGREKGPAVPGRDARASIYDLQPQMWTHETDNHRASVILQGNMDTLRHPSMRAFILRSVAWSGNREDVDEFCTEAELADISYPAGGPKRGAEAIKDFRMQPGFEASVVATEPLVTKPIAIQWDGAGRMWVAETPEYPNGRRPLVSPAWKETGVLKPGEYERPAHDSISMLLDSDGDGRMDRKHVFYEGLELVTGFTLHETGVIAVAQPHIISLQDTTGDGKADTETPLFEGFAPGDTHFVANHFITAPDGWIYASTGSGAEARDPDTGEVMARISPGMFRFRPDGSAIQQVASQGGNSFGGEVTSDMELFHGKATSANPVQHVVLPEWVLARAPDTDARAFASVNPGRRVARDDMPTRAPIRQIDQVGRYSAACSTAIYEGGSWPGEYNGKIFMTEPILDIIHHEAMKPEGPTLEGELVLDDEEWLRSTDYWFCPVDITFGPDGAAYVLDFYTPVVTHNDTRGPKHSRSNASVRPDRDHRFGRIYRIDHREAKNLPSVDLYHASPAERVAAFRHPNRVVRFNAIRILLEQAESVGEEAVSALDRMATNESFAPARIQALWALHRLGELKQQTFAAALRAENADIRKNTMLIAEEGGLALDGPQAAAGLGDSDERVQLATLRALGASAMTSGAGEELLAASSKFRNPWAEAAAAAAGSRDASSQLETILSESGSVRSPDAVRPLAAALAENGDSRKLVDVLRASADSPNPELVTVVLTELGENPPEAPRNRLAALTSLSSILESPNPALAASALPLAVAWDEDGRLSEEITRVAAEIFKVARDSGRSDEDRATAIRTLIDARSSSPHILPNLLDMVGPSISDELAADLIPALAATGDERVGPALVSAYPSLSPAKRDAVVRAVVSRPEWSRAFLEAAGAGEIDPATLDTTQVARFTNHPNDEVAERARAAFGGSGGSKSEVIADLLPEMTEPADLANGEAMFQAACATCHRLGGEGMELGPDLDGIGANPVKELLAHIVDPNLVVDDEHRTWNITMKDGTQYSGLIGSENEARVRILMAGGVSQDLDPDDIAGRVKAENSLMPEGLEALGAPALRDIIAYLRANADDTAAE